MKGVAIVSSLIALSSLAAVLTGQDAHASALKTVRFNCSPLGRIKITEATPNEDSLRSPWSDFLVLTLPSGSEVKLIRSAGASVRNWTSPSTGITFSQAPTWTEEKLTFERDSYGYKKGWYTCLSQ